LIISCAVKHCYTMRYRVDYGRVSVVGGFWLIGASMELSSEILWRVGEKNDGDGWITNEKTPELPSRTIQPYDTLLLLMWLHFLIHVIQTRSILLWSVVCAFVGLGSF
jgi:hypothetical protein